MRLCLRAASSLLNLYIRKSERGLKVLLGCTDGELRLHLFTELFADVKTKAPIHCTRLVRDTRFKNMAGVYLRFNRVCDDQFKGTLKGELNVTLVFRNFFDRIFKKVFKMIEVEFPLPPTDITERPVLITLSHLKKKMLRVLLQVMCAAKSAQA